MSKNYPDEFAVELYDQNDRFIRQIDIFYSAEEAQMYIKNHEAEHLVNEGDYLRITVIEYDDKGNELYFYPLGV